MPLLLAIAVITPPWQNPDEPFHMLRAVNVAHGGILGSRAWGTAGGESDPAIYDAYTPVQPVAMHPERRLSLPALAASGAVRWRPNTIYTPFPNTVQYAPPFYLPDAAAYWLGRATHLSVNHTLLLARALNALLFSVLAAIALSFARRTRLPLAAILLLPASLSLAASASQDSLLLACTALAVALLDRAIDTQRAATARESILLTGLLICVALARPPYAGFILLLLLLPSPPRPLPRALPASAAAIVLAWCLAVAWHVSVKLGGADLHAQLAFLAANPARIPAIIANTLRTFAVEYAVQFIGVLGWTDTRLPRLYIIAAWITILLAVVAGTNGPSRRPLVPLAAALFATIAIFILQYLTWTWPGQPLITGVLGRYFLPIAMVLTLAVPRLNLPLGPAATAALVLQAIATPAIMLHALVVRYYLAA